MDNGPETLPQLLALVAQNVVLFAFLAWPALHVAAHSAEFANPVLSAIAGEFVLFALLGLFVACIAHK